MKYPGVLVPVLVVRAVWFFYHETAQKSARSTRLSLHIGSCLTINTVQFSNIKQDNLLAAYLDNA